MPARTKKIYFRLNEDELKALEGVCGQYGIRSVSEAVRAAIENWIGVEDTITPAEDRIPTLQARLQVLRAEADIVARRIEQRASECAVPRAAQPIPINHGSLAPAAPEIAGHRLCMTRVVESGRKTG